MSVDVMLMVMCKNVAWLFQNALVLPQIIACLETLPLLKIQGCVVRWTVDSWNIISYSATVEVRDFKNTTPSIACILILPKRTNWQNN